MMGGGTYELTTQASLSQGKGLSNALGYNYLTDPWLTGQALQGLPRLMGRALTNRPRAAQRHP